MKHPNASITIYAHLVSSVANTQLSFNWIIVKGNSDDTKGVLNVKCVSNDLKIYTVHAQYAQYIDQSNFRNIFG